MYKNYLLITSLIICMTCFFSIDVSGKVTTPSLEEGSFIVKYKDSPYRIQSKETKKGLAKINCYEITYENALEKDKLYRAFKNNKNVEYIEEPVIYSIFDATPSPIYNDYSVTNDWGVSTINADRLWASGYTGQTVKVAIIDTGIATESPEFDGRIIDQYDFVDDDMVADMEHPHGGEIASIIGATADNLTGRAGIAHQASFMIYKVLDGEGNGGSNNIAKAILRAAEHGADIINLSLGGDASDQTTEDAINVAIDSGCIIIAASGNNGYSNQISYPARLEQVIAVGSIDKDQETISYFSNKGHGLSFLAPGNNIPVFFHPFNETDKGTSYSCAYVSGLYAQLLSSGLYTKTDVSNYVMYSCQQLPNKAPYNIESGYGIVNALNALRLRFGDNNYDDQTDVLDIINTAKKNYDYRYDHNFDGSVDVFDMIRVRGSYGE